ncbi:hypothetical protein Tco_0010136 [Tanacetum coccineum]
MGDKNSNRPRTLVDYSRPSHKGYRNAIELPEGAKVSPLRSNTIRLVQNRFAFHGLMSEDPIQHLKDFLRIVDSIDINAQHEEEESNDPIFSEKGSPDYIDATLEHELESMECRVESLMRNEVLLEYEMALPVQNINHSDFRSMFEREKLSRNNFSDWFCLLKFDGANVVTMNVVYENANKKLLKAKGEGKANGKGKDKQVYIPKPKNLKPSAKEHPAKDNTCHHCKEGFREARKLKQGALYLYLGNGVRTQVEAIRSYDLVLPNGLVICLDNCHYAPSITRGVVSVHRLVENGFDTQRKRWVTICYFPPENKIVVARLTSKIPMEVEGFEPPQEEVILVRRSERTHRAPDRLCHVQAEEHSLGDLNEPLAHKPQLFGFVLISGASYECGNTIHDRQYGMGPGRSSS